MSIVTLQLGQCGNQLGCELFKLLLEDSSKLSPHHRPRNSTEQRLFQEYEEETHERFFTTLSDGSLNARAVLVDMEQKVISQCFAEAKKSGKWCYKDEQKYCRKRGSGNNWAHGYNSHGPRNIDKILELVRKEVEKCDRFGGFMALMSLAGGTGSGVGAYVTDVLRETYPHSFILNQVVWPYNMGEVIVQNYNAVLTLSHLYQSSDAIIVHENDKLHKICEQLLNIKHVSFKDINKVICHKLASVLQPVKIFQGSDHDSMAVSDLLGDIVEQLCPHPEYKLLSVRNIPQMAEKSLAYSAYNWPGLMKHLRQMLIANASMEEGINWEVRAPALSGLDERPSAPKPLGSNYTKSVANLVIARGRELSKVDVSSFTEPQLYVDWNNSSSAVKTWSHPRPFCGYEKSVTLLSNSQAPVAVMDNVVHKAWNMFASRAYIHQYVRHGIEEDDFVDSFACLEQVIKNYSRI